MGTQSITRDLTHEYLRKMRLSPAPSFERQDIDLMFREMDEAGIEMGVIGVPAPTDKPGFESTGNQIIAGMVKRYPRRFVGFGSLDAADPAGALEEIRRVVDLGLVGLTDAEAMDAREFALQVSLLDPAIFTGEHPDVERETGVKRLRQFLQLRFDQRRCDLKLEGSNRRS